VSHHLLSLVQEKGDGEIMGALQYVATYCNTLQHAATRCNTLQRTTT